VKLLECRGSGWLDEIGEEDGRARRDGIGVGRCRWRQAVELGEVSGVTWPS
jgi:hypothetical protein